MGQYVYVPSSHTYDFMGEKLINIHSVPEHYKNSGALTSMYKKQDRNKVLQNMMSRYVDRINSQIKIVSSKGVSDSEFQDAYDKAKYDAETIEELSTALANQYNSIQLHAGVDPMGAFAKLRAAIANTDYSVDQMMKACEEYRRTFLQYSVAMGLISAANTKNRLSSSIDDLFNVKNLREALERIKEGGQSPGAISSFLTDYSEYMSAAISAVVAGYGDIAAKEAAKVVDNMHFGSSEIDVVMKLSSTDGLADESDVYGVSTTDKSADTGGAVHYIQLSSQKNGLNIVDSIEWTPYESVKAYVGSGKVSLTSHGGINSILIPFLHKIYGTSDAVNYDIYNSLSFSKFGASEGQQDVFRIIRETMINNLAAEFIAGIGDRTQAVFIYNFTAIPVISILNDIIEHASRTAEGYYYGSNKNAIFNISITGQPNNVFVGTNKSLYGKFIRIKRNTAAINRMTVKGKMNQNYLKLMQANMKMQNGIKNVIPRVKL